MKKRLNFTNILVLIIFTIILILIVIAGIKLRKDFFSEKEETVQKEIDSLELYGYTLNESDNEIYKTYFDQLKLILNEEEVNYEEYASLVVKLFVVDFYTLENKIASTDIGGLEFIHIDLIENFKVNAGDTMYNTIESNVDGTREQEIPEVSEVSIENIEKITYEYKQNSYEGYKVSANWNYVKDLGYDKNGTYILILDNNKLNIVEGGLNE